MPIFKKAWVLLALCFSAVSADLNGRRSSENLVGRQSTASTDLEIDLGYQAYRGYHNASQNLNIWKGIRYAAPPTGDRRWQAPQQPLWNRSQVADATEFSYVCPQQFFGPINGDEDCLSLNIWAPPGAKDLPVFFWIHGGGYVFGGGDQGIDTLITANNNSFVGVTIQYRLGAFGFLSSDEVAQRGTVNAGLLDQYAALEWAKQYIGLFGGNASQITIAGESAGAGSVMLQGMAYGGKPGNSLFQNIIGASPYLPFQWDYNAWVPSQAYYAFAREAGCDPLRQYGYNSSASTVFDCLVGLDQSSLINASLSVGPFNPVTDGTFLQQRPSQQYLKKQLNGHRMLIGQNALEGPGFADNQGLETEQDLVDWIHKAFPQFSNDDIAKVLLYYPSTNASDDPDARRYSTNGRTGATAVNVSQVATGQQQRANDITAESWLVCPTYWMAEGFSGKGRLSYKYQYSVPVATHASDVAGYFGPARPNLSSDFMKAFMTIWGNFITTNDPSISQLVADGVSNNSTETGNAGPDWPPYHIYAPYQLNLNETGGTPFQTQQDGVNVTEFQEPGLMNNFTLVNAYTWEGGRGYRCDFWRSVGSVAHE